MNSLTCAPIVLFVYNRLNHTSQTIEALKKNDLAVDSHLYIFSDGAKNKQDSEKVEDVRKYIAKVKGFKKITIIKRSDNWGLSKSIIDGVTQIVNKYGRVIVLEDDLVTSKYFLKYMNEALDLYFNNEKVISIHGYFYPIENIEQFPETFFIRGADCWGWATWKRGWDLFEPSGQKLLDSIKAKGLQKDANFNNSYNYVGMLKDQINDKNDSWAVRWYISAFLKDKLTLYPKVSFVKNIGNDGTGTHKSKNIQFLTKKLSNGVVLTNDEGLVLENADARKYIEKYFRSLNPSFFSICWSFLKKIISK